AVCGVLRGGFPQGCMPRVLVPPPYRGVNSVVPWGPGFPPYTTFLCTEWVGAPPVQADSPTRRAPTRTKQTRTERFIGETPPTGADAGPFDASVQAKPARVAVPP